MNWYLRSDATRLSEKDIQDIIDAKNSIKQASEVMANKYKISSRWVYQIWRGVHPPIDPKEMVSCPPTDPPSDSKKMVSTNTEKTVPRETLGITIPEKIPEVSNKAKKTGGRNPRAKSVTISEPSTIQTKPSQGYPAEGTVSLDSLRANKGLRGEDLRAFYEKDAKEDEKSKAETARLLAIT